MENSADRGIYSWVLSSAFGRGPSGPSSAIWLTLQRCMTKRPLPWQKYMSPLFCCREELSIVPEHNYVFPPWVVVLCALCVSAGAMGVGRMMDREKEEEGSPGSSAQDAIWPAHVDLLIFGVHLFQHQSWVFFSLSSLTNKTSRKTTEQRVWVKLEL